MLPKGVSKVVYQTQRGKKTKYQVRISIKCWKFSKLVDKLDEAKKIVAIAKGADGKRRLQEYFMGVERDPLVTLDKAHKTLRDCLQDFAKAHYHKVEISEVERRNNKIVNSQIRSIVETKIDDREALKGLPPYMRESYGHVIQITFGKLYPEEMEVADITAFVNAKLEAGLKPQTINRYLTIIGCFFNSFYAHFGDEYKSLQDINPVPKAKSVLKRNKLKSTFVKRERRLSEYEEEAILEVLSRIRNKEMLWIPTVSLTTGMRRSEVIMLKAKNIKETIAIVENPKNGKQREVKTLGVSELLNELAKNKSPEERLFKLTIAGFKTNWGRAKEKLLRDYKISDIRFHDLRSEFISRILQIDLNEYAAAEIAGITNQPYFDRIYGTKLKKIDGVTTANIKDQVGHSSSNVTAGYARKLVKE